MPYPNEHAARINAPGKYTKFRRDNNAFGKGIHVIWGLNQKVEIQAIRFDAVLFTVADAKKWLKQHNYTFIKFEEAIG